MKKIFTVSLFLVMLTCSAFAQITVNGDLSESQYVTLATKQNSNANWGNIDISKIVYYPDVTNSVLYIGVVGKLDVGSNNEIAVWLNVMGPGAPVGRAAGTSLSVSNGSAGYIGDSNNPNYKADFEVDYMFGFNPGNGSSNVYFDAGKLVGTAADEYQGYCDQSGTAAADTNAAGGVFTKNSITFAFNNDGGTDHGLEMAIPFDQIGAAANDSIQVFACVVSFSAYFSDITVPGDLSTDPGFNASFDTLATGPFHCSNPQPLPVELKSFTAIANGNSVDLKWQTASELNNSGFDVERMQSSKTGWEKIGFIKGTGSSVTSHNYSFTDDNLASGKYSYRLKQIDLDGSYKYSNVVEVNISQLPGKFVLDQNYPNPFNPSTTIKFSFAKNTHASLKVYDVLGNQVSTLFDDNVTAGREYSVKFDASKLSSGVYYYKLSGGSNIAIKKMLLLK